MVDYINAMNIHMPQLELFSWVAKDLQAWIDNNKKTYREAEEEVSKVTPTLFHEYSLADELDRADLLVCHYSFIHLLLLIPCHHEAPNEVD